jgi:dUTP pyrophosphatase
MFKFGNNKTKTEPNVGFQAYEEHDMSLPVKVKKVLENAQLPVKATAGAAAYDVFAAKETFLNEPTGPVVEYDTGLSFEVPPGYYIDARARSSVTTKTTLVLGNGAGVIDSDYRGTVKFQFRNTNMILGKRYKVGDRIGQIIFKKYEDVTFEVVDELSDTARGQGGFGSTKGF